jgi:hypothetical protein
MLAYDYPLLSIFWSMLWFFLFFAWLMLLFRVFADIFRSRDMGGFAKAMWSIFVIVAPFLGVLIYLVARGDNMAQNDMAALQAQDAAMRSYIQDAAGSSAPASQIQELAALRDSGVISAEEFEAGKAKILG